MKINIYALLASVVFVAACEQNPDGSYGKPGGETWYETSSPEAKAAYFLSVCMGYGFERNTPQLAQCIAQETRDARRSYDASVAQAMMGIAATMPRQTTCTSIGYTTNCSTF